MLFVLFRCLLSGTEKDRNDIKTVLLEVIGVVLSNIPGYKFKKALLVYGKGNTGKTQIRNLAISLVGFKRLTGL